MFRRQYNILKSFLDESKQGGYQNGVEQYQFCCPYCAEENGGKPDGKYNLEVNFLLGKCHCWKCDMKGNVNRIVKKYGGVGLAAEYLEDIRMILSTQLYHLNRYEELVKLLDEEEIKLPKTFTPIGNINELRNGKLKTFLQTRHITQEIIDTYHIGYTKWDNEEKNVRSRIIVPSYDNKGNLTYWTGRDFTGYEGRQKYLNVKADRKKIIFNEGLIEWDGDIVLVEGIIDSLVYPNCIPLMGKQLYSDSRLYDMLVKRSNANIIICLDSDTDISETKRIYRLLNKGRLKGKIRYIRMDKYKDFGEIFEQDGKQGLINVLAQSKQFSEFELIF
jgi:DNA primase